MTNNAWLIYQLTLEKPTQSKSSCWKFALCVGNSKKSEVEVSEAGASTLLLWIPRLTTFLRSNLQQLVENNPNLSLTFRNELFFWSESSTTNPYKRAVQLDEVNDLDRYWAAYIFFASLSEVLSSSDNSTSFFQVYSAWQRYNLIKFLTKTNSSKSGNDYEERIKINEFANAYRQLTTLLSDAKFSYAWRALWLEGWWQNTGRKPKKSDAEIRQRLRLSMFLTDEKQAEITSLESPIPAPGCFDADSCSRKRKTSQLHNNFVTPSGKGTVKRLINNELLPQYDIRSAIYLAGLLTGWRSIANRLLPGTISLLFAFILVLVLICSIEGFEPFLVNAIPHIDSFKQPLTHLVPYVCVLGTVVIIAISLVGLGAWNSATLFLPRTAGGITIGYFPLLIAAEQPWYLTLYASKHHWVWWIEWLVVMLLAWGYLYREAYPFVLQHWTAVLRSFRVFVWATVQAILIGFWLTLISAPIHQQLEYDSSRIDYIDTIKSVNVTTDSNPEIPSQDTRKPVTTGLAYSVPIPCFKVEFPISVLLTFAPVSLLLGIAIQILWEEEPVTASIWPTENL